MDIVKETCYLLVFFFSGGMHVSLAKWLVLLTSFKGLATTISTNGSLQALVEIVSEEKSSRDY